MEKINSILLAGGTHGNELTGVYLIKKIEENLDFYKNIAKGIELKTLLSNPHANRLCRRYEHQDLNRSFSATALGTTADSLCYEINRAKWINETFGPKGAKTKTDLIIDIHNTTSNMGLCLILSTKDPFTTKASAVLTKEFPEARIYYQPEERNASPYLGTIAKADICLEIGPQMHGTLAANLFEKAERLIRRYLELAVSFNEGILQETPGVSVDVYTQLRDIDYPRDASFQISAMIHPDLLGNDYLPLTDGNPLFKTFDGKDILYRGETVYPIFINEAAYYEKKIAMSLTTKSREIF